MFPIKPAVFLISDIHLEWQCECKPNKYPQRINALADRLVEDFDDIPKENRILIIAGDIANSNYPAQLFLESISKKFRDVLFIPGNHDFYMESNKSKTKYKQNSRNRINDLYNNKPENVHFLDMSYDGIYSNEYKIGGATMFSNPRIDTISSQWYDDNMNDAKYIRFHTLNHDRKDISEEYFDDIVDYINMPSDLDIFVSHYPTIETSSNKTFDISKCAHLTPQPPVAPIHVFGHTHELVDFEQDGTRYISNATGYDRFAVLKQIL